MFAQYKKLDNPAWHALNERHASFADGAKGLKRYQPGVLLFSGYNAGMKNITGQLDDVVKPGESFFLFDNHLPLPGNYETEAVIECMQMVCDMPVPVPITETIVPLTETNEATMFSLVSEVFPGYYLPKTRLLGDYVGIYKDGKLVAMAGERMCMDEFTEISAVVTHPAYTGRRYAQQLVTYLNNKNRQAGFIPFLHTGSGNERAIKIYELLGYQKRRIIPVTKFRRTG